MATGRMVGNGVWQRVRHSMLVAVGCLCSAQALAIEVGLAGFIASKALVIVDGGEPQPMAVGQGTNGVKLLAIQGDQVVVEVDGKRRALRIGQYANGVAGNGGGKAILTANHQGHFLTDGTINGIGVKFLVDTGATMIALGASDAKRIGLDPARGQRGMVTTANGQLEVSQVKLDTVRVGEITLHNVDAVIQPNDLTTTLLGMSFLNRMEMQRDGSTMTLRKRF